MVCLFCRMCIEALTILEIASVLLHKHIYVFVYDIYF